MHRHRQAYAVKVVERGVEIKAPLHLPPWGGGLRFRLLAASGVGEGLCLRLLAASSGALPHTGGVGEGLFHSLARSRAALEQFLVRALEYDVPAIDARAGPHVHDVVGNAYHLAVVLYEQDGVACVAQAPHAVLHQFYVAVMEAYAGLVEYVEHVGERRVDVFGYLTALRFAARESAYGAVEAEVA